MFTLFLGKCLFQSADVWILGVTDDPQELRCLSQILEMPISDLFTVQVDVERAIQKGKAEVKRNHLLQEIEAAPYRIFCIVKVNNGALFMSSRLLANSCHAPL